MEANLEKLENEIKDFYNNKSRNNLGWRLLSSPASTIYNADIAFIGMNPGGNKNYTEHPSFCTEPGISAYRDEHWENTKLQKQVLSLFKKLGVNPEKILSGNFVPFRSPNWKSLNNKSECLQFSYQIWKNIFDIAKPKLVIGMGKEVTSELITLLKVQNLNKIQTGWGNISASKGTYCDGTFIGLPHLSRFGIIDRPESQKAIETLFDGYLKK